MSLQFIKKYRITFIVIIIVFFYGVSWLINLDNNRQFRYGVTFSQPYAQYLGLDWKLVLTEILDDLQIQNYRLVAYWNLIEIGPGVYDFSDLDWQINEVAKRGGNVILAVGLRVPRWPECHIPVWASNLPEDQLIEANKEYIEAVVKHYSDSPNIKTITNWQVENEPFLNIFGHCIRQNESIVSDKVGIVKNLSKLPVTITDSGELGGWHKTAKLADLLGISIYRRVSQPIVGYINYPLPPVFYSLRAWLVGLFVGNNSVYISELQLEPWINGNLIETTVAKQKQAMSEEHMINFINYAKRTGLNPIYFWGVEWWYYMKQKGEPGYWDEIKNQIEINATKK